MRIGAEVGALPRSAPCEGVLCTSNCNNLYQIRASSAAMYKISEMFLLKRLIPDMHLSLVSRGKPRNSILFRDL